MAALAGAPHDLGGPPPLALSLVGTCRLHGIDPWEYLHTALDVINDQPVSKIGERAPIHAALAPVVYREATIRQAGMAGGGYRSSAPYTFPNACPTSAMMSS